jgi:adenosylcobinamide-GDP ribazoletransferase
MWRPCLCAGRFLTRLPLPDPGPLDGPVLGRAVLCYPLVGLVIGGLLWGTLWSLLQLHPGLVAASQAAPLAALVLIAWVWLTGGLHLDGLADSADAWVGGLGDRARTLEILGDPRIGAMGALALGLALLAKWSALLALIVARDLWPLVWVPVLARVQILLLMLSTPYARPGGMAAQALACLPRGWAWLLVVLSLALVGFALVLDSGRDGAGWGWLLPLGVAGATLVLWRRSMRRRLGGFTGDTAGALVEMTEAAVLLALALGSV